MEIKILNKGSFTIEAAMIMGMVLVVLLSVLSGARTVYNRTLYTAHAYEVSVTGREKELAGLWSAEGSDEKMEQERVELELIEPVSFLWKMQYIIKE